MSERTSVGTNEK